MVVRANGSGATMAERKRVQTCMRIHSSLSSRPRGGIRGIKRAEAPVFREKGTWFWFFILFLWLAPTTNCEDLSLTTIKQGLKCSEAVNPPQHIRKHGVQLLLVPWQTRLSSWRTTRLLPIREENFGEEEDHDRHGQGLIPHIDAGFGGKDRGSEAEGEWRST